MQKQDPTRQYLYLECPRYLAQWYGHRQYVSQHAQDEYADDYIYDTERRAYDLDVVVPNRLHPESVLMNMLLVKQGSVPDLPSDDVTLCIQIPEFKDKPSCVYNRLSQHSKHKLIEKLKAQFDADIVQFVVDYRAKLAACNPSVRACANEAVDAFMDMRGIDPSYIDTVIKAYNRAVKRYRATLHYQSKINQSRRKR